MSVRRASRSAVNLPSVSIQLAAIPVSVSVASQVMGRIAQVHIIISLYTTFILLFA